jgi:hypothetical protein
MEIWKNKLKKLKETKELIKDSGLKNIVLNSPEYEIRTDADKYNL